MRRHPQTSAKLDSGSSTSGRRAFVRTHVTKKITGCGGTQKVKPLAHGIFFSFFFIMKVESPGAEEFRLDALTLS